MFTFRNSWLKISQTFSLQQTFCRICLFLMTFSLFFFSIFISRFTILFLLSIFSSYCFHGRLMQVTWFELPCRLMQPRCFVYVERRPAFQNCTWVNLVLTPSNCTVWFNKNGLKNKIFKAFYIILMHFKSAVSRKPQAYLLLDVRCSVTAWTQ